MNQCLTREQIVAVLTEDLAPEELSRASEHLNACDTCQKLADELTDDPEFRREFAGCGSSVASPSAFPPLFTSGHDLGTTVANNPATPSHGEAPTDPLWPPELGRYVVLGEISRGAFGEVWNAYDPILQRNVAVKLVRRDRALDSRYPDGFLAEGRKLAELDHPGIVRIFDAGEHEGYTYLVTEMLSGGTLASRLQSGPLAAVDAARIVEMVARAAHAAHLRGVVHRDIKPGNIILGEDDLPRLADFGLAASEEEMLRESPGSLGTLSYMSPEQIAGHSNQVDARADVYSLGVVLYRCLTGRLPFKALTVEQLHRLIQFNEPRPLRTIDDGIPPELEAICLKCLRKHPYDRFSTAKDLSDALESWARSSACRTPSLPTSDAPPESATEPGQCPASLPIPRDPVAEQRSRWSWWASRLAAAMLSAALCAAVVWTIATGSLSERRESNVERGAAGVPNTEGDRQQQTTDAIPAPFPKKPLRVRIVTEPPDAQVVVYPIDQRYGMIDGARRQAAEQRSPVELELVPGFYFVVAALDDGRFHEVYRTVPLDPHALSTEPHDHLSWRTRVDGTVEWFEIVIPPLDTARTMGWFAGAGSFKVGIESDPRRPAHDRFLAPYYLDAHEVSWEEFLAANEGHLPASLVGADAPADRNLPITGVWWNDAVMYAEAVGKRLPTEAEYEFAATNGGTRRFPWGDDPPQEWEWQFGPVGTPLFDMIDAGVPVTGLYSNVAEWTSSWAAPYPPLLDYQPAYPPRPDGFYIVRGGPWSVIQGTPQHDEFHSGPRERIGQHWMKDRHPGLGFRCARSARPSLQAEDLERVLGQ